MKALVLPADCDPAVRARRREIGRRLAEQRPARPPMPVWWIGGNTVHRGPSCPVSDLNVTWRTGQILGDPATVAHIADHPRLTLCQHCFTEREHHIMAILDLPNRMRELGRIRIGQQVQADNGKMRPEKLDRFRFTSYSEPLIKALSDLYGGTVEPWTPAGSNVPQWEVVTDAKRIPVLIPPQPLTQFYETWSGGGCQRRCDGERELLADTPCICAANGQEGIDRECKPTTRLNVIVRDVPGVGMFRLESHGWYAAIELPQLALFLAQASGTGSFLEAWLGLEERTIKRPGQPTRRFVVPTLDVDITPAQLMAGGTSAPGELAGASVRRTPRGRCGTPGPRAIEAVAEAEVIDPREALYQARRELDAVADTLGLTREELAADYATAHNGAKLVDANAHDLNTYRATLEARLDAFVGSQS